jgi:hypothetical protein
VTGAPNPRELQPVIPRPDQWTLLVRYLEAMTDLEPRLSAAERDELQAWYRSPQFGRDSDWPGWQRHLGPRPDPPRRLKLARHR